ncbi:hypothetical protein GCK32_012457, partial [Trichostrongylus colubriformis]
MDHEYGTSNSSSNTASTDVLVHTVQAKIETRSAGKNSSTDSMMPETRDMLHVTLEDFLRCFNDPNMIKPHTTNYFEYKRVRKDEPAMRVIGITPDCFVYYGWLHDIVNPNAEAKHLRTTRQEDLSGQCADFYPFIIRTEGKKEQLIIGVKRAGRRMLVQSLGKKDLVVLESDKGVLVWSEINPKSKHEQFLSNEFPPDFTFDTFKNLLYRIFLLGRSSKGARILELKVFMDDNKNIFPFITSRVLHVDPILHAPLHGVALVATHNIHYMNTI